MNIVWAALIVVVATAVSVTAILAVRRRAPDGGYYNDSDRASGVFGVLATGFSVLLGFLIFLAFESYDASRSGAEIEALTVAQQVQTAQRLSADVGDDLTGELICYARWVIDEEWARMEAGTLGEDISPWGAAMFETLQGYEPGSAVEEANYSKWLDQTEAREIARQDRIHGASGIMPVPLWIVLFFIAAIIVVFLFGMADSGERVWVPALFMGSVVAVITAMLLLLSFLDDPVHDGIGGLQPDAMERTLLLIDQQLAVIDDAITIPCDDSGIPV
jgi:phosphatidylglycerophosphate synthase